MSVEQQVIQLINWIGASGAFAPLLFIFLHLLRQFLFIPVGFICVVGGLLFGVVFGTIYSVIGITLVSVFFYGVVKRLPNSFAKLLKTKERWLGKRATLSVGQVTILRLVPFVHFHLISLCLIEITRNFKEYAKVSFLANLPLAVVYTSFGNWMNQLSLQLILFLLFALAVLFYLFRKKEWVIKWSEFFPEARSM
jgi:uncharacterized membrane protein YdjX (TVP38/TMEM64 family)